MLRGAKGIRDTTVDNCPSEDIPAGGGFIEKCPADSGTSWVRLSTTLNGGESAFDVDRSVLHLGQVRPYRCHHNGLPSRAQRRA